MERLVNGELVQVGVSALNDDGLGVGHVAGAAAVIGNGLPGEEGEALVVHRGQNKSVLRLFQVQRSHAQRVAPECPRWTPASPCRLMHGSETLQLEFKHGQVQRALEAQGLNCEVAPNVSAGHQTGWRSRVIYLTRQHRGHAVLGAYRRGSHQVQDMLDCLLPERALLQISEHLLPILQDFRGLLPHATAALDPGCGEPLLLNQLRANLGRPVSPATRGSGGELHYIALRANAAGECMVCFLGDLTSQVANELAQRCLAVGAVSVFVGQSGPGDAVFGPEAPTWVAGAKSLIDEVDGLRFELLPRTFFQVHRSAAARLQRDALEHVVGERVLDVFSGVGALALRAARRGCHVTAIESVPESRELALRNAEQNGLELSLVGSEAAEALQSLIGTRFDTILVNPPRKGLGPGVAPRLCELAPTRIVYVSCNPKSLARDISELVGSYQLTSVTPYDLFPASEHVETLAVLERA
ncbi:MAG: class I SAM-dependent RNA methyltransferase [Polyangiaceae bacterium]